MMILGWAESLAVIYLVSSDLHYGVGCTGFDEGHLVALSRPHLVLEGSVYHGQVKSQGSHSSWSCLHHSSLCW